MDAFDEGSLYRIQRPVRYDRRTRSTEAQRVEKKAKRQAAQKMRRKQRQ